MSAVTTFNQIATHGARPASVPNQNGIIDVSVRPGGLYRSCSQPKRIMATLAPATAITAVISVMPEYAAMSSTIRVALIEYSTQRKRLMPRCRSDSSGRRWR